MKKKLKLGVNIDHVATLRQARGVSYPSPLEAAEDCRRAGADGITVHLREDRRHIQDHDVFDLRAWDQLPLNLEMAHVPEIVEIALRVRPAEVCLVPERREELTTEGGLNAAREARALAPTVRKLRAAGILVSLFVDAREEQLVAAAETGATHVELHTGRYCDAPAAGRTAELTRLVASARRAAALGLVVNAGHGINLDNLSGLLEIPGLHALNIGHSLVARAIHVGLETAVREMIAAMAAYDGGFTPTSQAGDG